MPLPKTQRNVRLLPPLILLIFSTMSSWDLARQGPVHLTICMSWSQLARWKDPSFCRLKIWTLYFNAYSAFWNHMYVTCSMCIKLYIIYKLSYPEWWTTQSNRKCQTSRNSAWLWKNRIFAVIEWKGFEIYIQYYIYIHFLCFFCLPKVQIKHGITVFWKNFFRPWHLLIQLYDNTFEILILGYWPVILYRPRMTSDDLIQNTLFMENQDFSLNHCSARMIRLI